MAQTHHRRQLFGLAQRILVGGLQQGLGTGPVLGRVGLAGHRGQAHAGQAPHLAHQALVMAGLQLAAHLQAGGDSGVATSPGARAAHLQLCHGQGLQLPAHRIQPQLQRGQGLRRAGRLRLQSQGKGQLRHWPLPLGRASSLHQGAAAVQLQLHLGLALQRQQWQQPCRHRHCNRGGGGAGGERPE